MTTIDIKRIKCDGCSHVIDDKEHRDETWLRLEVKRPDDGEMSVRTLDLCTACGVQLTRRCAEVGIKL